MTKEEKELKAKEAAGKAELERLEEENLSDGKELAGTELGKKDQALADQLGIKPSKITIRTKDPLKLAKEEAKHDLLAAQRIKKRIGKAKAAAKRKPIDDRRLLLAARFAGERSGKKAPTFTDKNLEAWMEEYKVIKSSPKSWNRITKNGTKPFVPDNKQKQSTRNKLHGLDLDDDGEE